MSAFIQPNRTIIPIFRSYLVVNNESQLLACAETSFQCKKKTLYPCGYLVSLNQTRQVARCRMRWYYLDIFPSSQEFPLGHARRRIGSSRGYTFPLPREVTLEVIQIPNGRLSRLQPSGR